MSGFTFNPRHVMTHAISLAVAEEVPVNMLRNGDATLEEYMARRLLLHHRTWVRGGAEREKIKVDVRWPADWWQAVRERWAPKWWLKRHPVRYHEVHVDRWAFAAVCPHLETDGREVHLDWLARTDEFARISERWG